MIQELRERAGLVHIAEEQEKRGIHLRDAIRDRVGRDLVRGAIPNGKDLLKSGMIATLGYGPPRSAIAWSSVRR